MAKIIITLSNSDVGNMLLGWEISVIPNVKTIDNLSEIVLKTSPYDLCIDSEIDE